MLFPIKSLTENSEADTMDNNIKVFRAMHKLTQEQLADKIGVSRQTIIAIESNRYLPSLGLAFRIAKLFKVPIEDVFSYHGGTDENN